MSLIKLLGFVPFVAVLVGVIFFNRVTPLIFGLPVLLVWLLACMLLTSAVMAVIFYSDPANRLSQPDRETGP